MRAFLRLPCLWHNGKDAYLITHGNDYAIAHRLEDGSEIWRVGDLNPKAKYNPTLRFVASPVATPDLIVVPSAKNGPVVGLKPDASGLVTAGSQFEQWRRPNNTPDVPSPLVHDGLVYLCRENGLSDLPGREDGQGVVRRAHLQPTLPGLAGLRRRQGLPHGPRRDGDRGQGGTEVRAAGDQQAAGLDDRLAGGLQRPHLPARLGGPLRHRPGGEVNPLDPAFLHHDPTRHGYNDSAAAVGICCGGPAMPIHDWTRIGAGIFHDFHSAWIAEIRRVLNTDLLPPEYYALAEQIAGGLGPDVLTLQAPAREDNGSRAEVRTLAAVAEAPPKVRLTFRAEIDEYTLKQRSLVIRHSSNHRIVALIEILSPGNKSSRHAFRAFLDKAAAAVAHGIHLLLLDLQPPGPRDPQGIHGHWQQLVGDDYEPPVDKPLTLVSYAAGPVKTAYVEPVAVGDVLPGMPLFLDPEQYVNVPLEATYGAGYEGVPRFYRTILEAAPG